MKQRVIQVNSDRNPFGLPILTPLTYDFTKSAQEETLGASCTVPDQSMSAADILSKFVRGLPVPVTQNFGYSDLDTSMFDHMDKFQKIDAARELEARRKIMMDKLNADKAEQSRKKFEEAQQKLVDDAIAKDRAEREKVTA